MIMHNVAATLATIFAISPRTSGLQIPALYAPNQEIAMPVFEFFSINIRSPITCRAYTQTIPGLAAWCEAHGLSHLRSVRPVHVAAYIEDMQVSPIHIVE